MRELFIFNCKTALVAYFLQREKSRLRKKQPAACSVRARDTDDHVFTYTGHVTGVAVVVSWVSDCQSLAQLDNGDNWGAIVPGLLCLTLFKNRYCKQEHMILSRLRVSLSSIDKSLNRAPKITISLVINLPLRTC